MRYDAAVRLGVDYESLNAIKPDLIYCHTRGFEHGERELLPGNDQTGAALAGPDWLDGGLDHDGIPLWPVISLGDTGNGFLSAIAMVQALYHRDRTGEGQFVDTSIIYAQLLNASIAWSLADGSRHGDRPSLDAMQLGYHARYRLYETADGWLCVAATTEEQRSALAAVLGVDKVTDDAPRSAALEPVFRTRSAAQWFASLDAAGVPVEVSTPRLRARPLRRPRDHREGLGRGVPPPDRRGHGPVRAAVRLGGDAGCRAGPTAHAGPEHTRDPAELGYDDDHIDKLDEEKVMLDLAGAMTCRR